ncbi:hypothetical protein [Lysobacter sp. Root96]|uniref:hypothetical protein n=1 Tax=Lysobacter sp. Root96 TaxID=1736612 RepID=UPI0006FCFC45|nr:hypothetical protein [Lysobacter sp. Root96]KRD71404.1 hypothetical protein ASE45_06230 [Lysobacter sp. Root96]
MTTPDFALIEREARITNINLRTERHGDDKVRAVDLSIETRAENTLLDSFSKGLKESFFRKPGKGEQQDLPNISPQQLTQVIHAFLGAQKLPHTFEGYELEIVGLLEKDEPTTLVDVKLKKFEFAMLEGGFIELSFTASASHITGDELLELDAAQLREVNRISVVRPAEQEQKQAA